ncbi:MAG: ribosome small subunit-dependent GTPase A [Planctomycetota bacterium]
MAAEPEHEEPSFRDVIDEREGALIDEEDRIDRVNAERVVPSDRPVSFLEAGPLAADELPEGTIEGRVISMHGDHFRVQTAGATGPATWLVHLARKLLIRERRFRHPVAVGDDVAILPVATTGTTGADEPQAQLVAIRERRTWLSRPSAKHSKRRHDVYKDDIEQVMVVNVDQLVVVMTASEEIGVVRTNLIDRFVVAAERGGMRAVVVINKQDLIPAEQAEDYEEVIGLYRGLGYLAALTSATTGAGIDQLREWLTGRTTVFAGPSGVGKSSLLNAVQPGLELRVSDVNRKTGRGRHTTTAVQLLPLAVGGWVVDTPGIREFGLHELRPQDAWKYFPEIEAAAAHCEFADCSHTGKERGCAVVAAMEDGEISDRRYDSFLAMVDTLTKR